MREIDPKFCKINFSGMFVLFGELGQENMQKQSFYWHTLILRDTVHVDIEEHPYIKSPNIYENYFLLVYVTSITVVLYLLMRRCHNRKGRISGCCRVMGGSLSPGGCCWAERARFVWVFRVIQDLSCSFWHPSAYGSLVLPRNIQTLISLPPSFLNVKRK